MSRLGVLVFAALALCGAGLALPGLHRASAKANRSKCSGNLRQLGLAALQYADDRRFFPHVGPIRELDGGVETADTPRALRALVRHGYLDLPQVFVCPSSADEAAPDLEGAPSWTWGSARGAPDADPLGPGPTADPALAETTELSYGWTRRGRNANTRCNVPLAADRAVRHPDMADPDVTSDDPLQGNHLEGLLVLRADATVEWRSTRHDGPEAADLARVDGGHEGALAILDPLSPRPPRGRAFWERLGVDALALLPLGLAGVLVLLGRPPAPPRPRRPGVERHPSGEALQAEQRCPYCHDGLDRVAALTRCTGCRAAFHAECVPEGAACTTLGCGARGAA
ncbi:MAG: PHD finger domain-containing protein [Planctomycetes bacterium]|nr:PHD finger domain-containing protein [Planctomycetota bacterium]